MTSHIVESEWANPKRMKMTPETPMLSDTWYNRLKWFVMTVLPAFSAAYFALGNVILNLPAEEAVMGVCAILATFLTAVLGLSNKSYVNSGAKYDGVVELVMDPGGVAKASLNIQGDPETLLTTKDEITFKVAR